MKQTIQTPIKLMAIILIMALGNSITAQTTIDIIPFYGWQMNGKVKFYQGELRTDDNSMYGAAMDIHLEYGMALRLQYSRTDTKSHFRPYSNYPSFDAQDFNMANEYYQIGAVKYLEKGNIEPFGSFTLGAARFNEKDLNENVWRFSITAGLGVKFFFSEKIGIKIQGDFMMPMYFEGVGFYFGTGGSGLTAYSSVPLLQGNFNGGLIFRLGN